MRRTPPLDSALALAILCAATLAGCGSDKEKSVDLLVIPNAVFVPSGSAATVKTTQTPSLTGPSRASVRNGAKAVWKVEFKSVTEITVSYVIIELEALQGRFVVPLEPAEVEAGSVEIPIYVSQAVGPEVCQRNFRGVGTCFTPMSEGTTDLAFVVAGDDGQGALVSSFSSHASLTVGEVPTDSVPRQCSSEQSIPCGCVMEACCDEASCGYLVNGEQWYACASRDNCGAAAQAVASWCTGMCQ